PFYEVDICASPEGEELLARAHAAGGRVTVEDEWKGMLKVRSATTLPAAIRRQLLQNGPQLFAHLISPPGPALLANVERTGPRASPLLTVADALVLRELPALPPATRWERLLDDYPIGLEKLYRWEVAPATEAQRGYLGKLGVEPPKGATKGEASRVISAL